MTKDELIKHIERIILTTSNNPVGGLAQAKEFLKIYIGSESHFLKSLESINIKNSDDFIIIDTIQVLRGLKDYVENDLLRSMSLEREIQMETVSDFLDQAEGLLNNKNFHPAAAAVLIGASLEEFLRNWLEELEFDLSTIKNSIDSYMKELKALGKINKQDTKDIISWGGTRNDAAHGHWADVDDRQRIKLMLESVNLFIRKYSII